MSDLSTLLFLLALVVVISLWLKLCVARERAVSEARQQCQQHGLQLLDESVGLRGLRLRRINGLRMIERCYSFEVSIDGADREAGRLWMIDNAVSGISLPTVELLPPAVGDNMPTLPTAQPSNVVPLRLRGENRLH